MLGNVTVNCFWKLININTKIGINVNAKHEVYYL